MNVRAIESANADWAALQGHVAGPCTLRNLLGVSEHSAVFLTDVADREPAQAAIKLVPTPLLAESLILRWQNASRLEHPHLLGLLLTGRCQFSGRKYLCAVMELSDQNLGQLLENRALTEDETREMLVPVLNALAFLHAQKLAHSRLKPSNILVVGEQLKLATDTIRAIGEYRDSAQPISAYDPPEARDGTYSAAGDMWALGISLCEALTQQQPALSQDGRSVVLPTPLPLSFRDLVERCLSSRAADRPSVADIEGWLRGQPLPPVASVYDEPFPIALSPAATATSLAADSTVAPTAIGGASSAAPSQAAASTAASAAPSPVAAPIPRAAATSTAAAHSAAAPTTAASATGTHRAMNPAAAPTAATSTTGTHRAMNPAAAPTAAASATGTHRAMNPAAAPTAATSTTGTHRAMNPAAAPTAATSTTGTHRAMNPAAAPGSATATSGAAATPTSAPRVLPRAASPGAAPTAAAPAAAQPITAATVAAATRAANAAPAPSAAGSPIDHASSSTSGRYARPASLGTPSPGTPRREPPAIAPVAPSAIQATAPFSTAEPAITSPQASARDHSAESSLRAGLGIPAIIAAVVLFVLGWTAVRALRTEPTPTPPPAIASIDDEAAPPSESAADSDFAPPSDSASRAVASSGNADSQARALGSTRIRSSKLPAGSSSASVSPSTAESSSLAVHQEFPDIPERAKRTIRGTVRVSVRVIVNEDGTVFAALTDDRGPSRYFERLAIEAAKKWTFIPADGGSDQRVMLIRFAFSRDNDTASAIPLK